MSAATLFGALVDLLRRVGRALTVDLHRNLDELRGLVCALVERCMRRCRLPNRLDRKTPFKCVPISDPAYKKPDPLIYAQYYLMEQGLAVTWDNPDITLLQGGVPVPSSSILPNTDYEVVARVWNNSTEAPVIGLPVMFWYLNFGVGTKVNFIGQTAVNLGVKGGPNHPAFASVKWRTPAVPGHYCIQVLLVWLDDANPKNNLGQENLSVGMAHSPATFQFALRNAEPELQTFRFEVDSYALPPRPPCGQRTRGADRPAPPLMTAPGTILKVPAGHSREGHALPPGWTVRFDPQAATLAPDEEITVQVSIEPPAGFRGEQPINVHAFTPRGLAGGVTLRVQR